MTGERIDLKLKNCFWKEFHKSECSLVGHINCVLQSNKNPSYSFHSQLNDIDTVSQWSKTSRQEAQAKGECRPLMRAIPACSGVFQINKSRGTVGQQPNG